MVEAYRSILDIPGMLRGYREAENIELLGMGHYHPIFPLIPKEDWGDSRVPMVYERTGPARRLLDEAAAAAGGK